VRDPLGMLTQRLLFASWGHLFDFMLEALEPAQAPLTRDTTPNL
jgi:hypothetical protein